MNKSIDLIPVDIKNKIDVDFLYTILLFRWKQKNIINIKHKTSDFPPSYEDHVKNLNSGKYKGIYKIHLYGNLIGMIYIDINNFNGTFLLPDLVKKALKNLKQTNIKIDKDEITPQIHLELLKIHNDVNVHYASVNPNNKLSLEGLIKNGYEPIEITLAITSENGKPTQGKWSIK